MWVLVYTEQPTRAIKHLRIKDLYLIDTSTSSFALRIAERETVVPRGSTVLIQSLG